MAESTQTIRLLQLLRFLTARRQGVSLREMATEHECNQKTIRRDLTVLRRIGFPLEETVGPHGRKSWKLDSTRSLPQLTFNLTEALSLYLGRRLLEPLAGTYVWDGAQTAFRKIRACLSEEAAAYVEQLNSTFLQTTLGIGDYTGRGKILDALMIGAEDRTTVRIAYHSLKNEAPQSYAVHPYGIVYHKGSLYLVAWSTHHKELRTFKVDRIESAESEGNEKFDRPADFNLTTHLATTFGVFQTPGPLQQVKIRFDPTVTRHIQEHHWHPSQKLTLNKDNSVTAEFQLTDLHELKSWVMSFGAKATVESPRELSDEIAQEIQEMLKNYGFMR